MLVGELRLEEDVRCTEAESTERIRWRAMRKLFPLQATDVADNYNFSVVVEEELPATILHSSSPGLFVSVAYSLRVQSSVQSPRCWLQ